MGRELVVLGAASVALNVLEIATALGYEVLSMVDETLPQDVEPQPRFGVPVERSIDRWLDNRRVSLAVAIGDNLRRARAVERLLRYVDETRFPSLVHPAASVSPFATVGPGCFVLPCSAIVANAQLGGFNYVSSNTMVGHDVVVNRGAWIGAGASLGGWSVIGARTFVGMNSVIREKVTIGEDVVVGAGSYVNCDLEDRVVAVGSPARILRSRDPDDPYLR